MKIAFVHDWLVSFGGSERVLQSFHELYPDAPIYTTIYNKDKVPQFNDATVITSYLNNIPTAKTRHQVFIPFMPRAVEHYDLGDFDIILSDSHACAKGAIKAPGAVHLCYCHTPMRYAWTPEIDPRASSSALRRYVAKRLQKWDLATVNRVDQYFANSNYIKERIKKFYNRDAEVIYPPIDIDHWAISPKIDNYFLYVSRLVDYKRPDLVVEAFNKLNLPLKIVGDGPLLSKLQSIAKPNIEFLGRLDENQLKDVYSHCLALIFPTIEDFGIVPVEVMASGRPVISINVGGATETVIDGLSGLHFATQSPQAIIEAVNKFKPEKFNPAAIRTHAQKFDKSHFSSKIKTAIAQANLSKNRSR